MSGKQTVLELLRSMPEEVALEEISQEVAILAAIQRGEEDVAAGRVFAHEDVKRMFASFLPPA
jgi:predicted transcriptional regulator